MECPSTSDVLPEASDTALNLPKDGHYKIMKSGKVKVNFYYLRSWRTASLPRSFVK